MERTLITIPAQAARSVNVARDDRVKIIDVEGGQVVDLFAFAAHDFDEYASAEHTRVAVNRLFPRVGEVFVTNRRRPILLLEEDRSPGVHDMLCAACDPARYRSLGVEEWHASCQENLQRVTAELGVERIEIPQPINLFMQLRVDPDGSFTWGPAPTRPGDHVVFRAALDCVLIASACPQDLNEINHYHPTSVEIELLDNVRS